MHFAALLSALIITRGELLLEQNLWCDKVRLTQDYRVHHTTDHHKRYMIYFALSISEDILDSK